MIQIVDRFPKGVVQIPLSKSEAHRALICAALSRGNCVGSLLESLGLSEDDCSEDILATAKGIKAIVMNGSIGGVIDCGESGSTLRFLIPVAAMTGGKWVFKGRGRLLDRPMGIFEQLFIEHGVQYEQNAEDITICGPLPVDKYELPGDVSSQFVTGLLMALPLADGSLNEVSEIRLSSPLESSNYVDLTISAMHAYGIEIHEIYDHTGAIAGWDVPASQKYSSNEDACDANCGGDWSQAAFFLCAGALGCFVSVTGLDLNSKQGDRKVLEIIESMGARIIMQDGEVQAIPPYDKSPLNGVVIDARDIPDIVPPLAALACYSRGVTRFVGAGRLRIKESDRLAALAEELTKIGADIRETIDGLIISGTDGGKLSGGSVQAHGDHRIAMALAVASIGCETPVVVDGSESVIKSYPNFWVDFLVREKL